MTRSFSSTLGLAMCAAAMLVPPSHTLRAQVLLGQPFVTFEVHVVTLNPSAIKQFREQESRTGGVAHRLAEKLALIVGEDRTDAEGGTANFSVTETLRPDEGAELLRALSGLAGEAIVQAEPRVQTRSDQAATMEITREMQYAVAFKRVPGEEGKPPVLTPTKIEKKPLGLTMKLTGSVAPERDAVDLNVSWQQVSLEGYVGAEDGKSLSAMQTEKANARPVFTTEILDTCVTVPPESTLLLGSLRRHGGSLTGGEPIRGLPQQGEAIAIALVTTRVTNGSAEKAADGEPSAATPAPPAEKKRGFPYAKRARGKPGYVTSPYAPDSGYVDVTGLERGTEVRDPYTNKIFLVP